jgi:hypothetical protein
MKGHLYSWGPANKNFGGFFTVHFGFVFFRFIKDKLNYFKNGRIRQLFLAGMIVSSISG